MRRLLRQYLLIGCIFACLGCGTFKTKPTETGLPSTSGAAENAPAYGDFPIDPVPIDVKVYPENGPELTVAELLRAMPNETVRIAGGKVDASGKVSFGPVGVGAAGNSYVVIVDINGRDQL